MGIKICNRCKWPSLCQTIIGCAYNKVDTGTLDTDVSSVREEGEVNENLGSIMTYTMIYGTTDKDNPGRTEGADKTGV